MTTDLTQQTTPSAPGSTPQDRMVEGQRRINLIWETTQAVIAVIVVAATMISALYIVFTGREGDVPLVLSSAIFLVIGFYFSRTNHAQIGGIGDKPDQEYRGR